MTEKEFDQRIEEMADRFERRIETAADRLDKGICRKYEESLLFRSAARGSAIAAAIGLMFSAKYLGDRGCKKAAVWCAVLGAVCLGAELLRILVFRRKK